MKMKQIIQDCISQDKSLSEKVRAYIKENRKLMMMKNLQDF